MDIAKIFNQQESNNSPLVDQRDGTHYPAGEDQDTFIVDTISGYLGGFRLSDILSTDNHTDDFKVTRSEYMLSRLRVLLIFFIVAVPAWLIIDLYTLSWEHFKPMIAVRISMSAVLLMICLQSTKKVGQKQTSVLLALTMLATMLFYAASILIVNSGAQEMPLAGYTVIPFLAISVMGLFPATILLSTSIMAMMAFIYIGLETYLGNLFSIEVFDALWIMAMTCGVTICIQSGQLLMLLKLYRESTRDPLTGLINRRVLMKQLTAEIEMQETIDRPFSVLMADLDRFKRVNDEYGHLVGDSVLKATARLIAIELRSSDVVARFGGEEFVVALPGQIGDEALHVAERIRQRFEQTRVAIPDGIKIAISVSLGVTEYEPGERVEATLARVNATLYKAKEQGRNRVEFSQSEKFTNKQAS